MRGKKNPPLDLMPAPDGAPVSFDTMATAYAFGYIGDRVRSGVGQSSLSILRPGLVQRPESRL